VKDKKYVVKFARGAVEGDRGVEGYGCG